MARIGAVDGVHRVARLFGHNAYVGFWIAIHHVLPAAPRKPLDAPDRVCAQATPTTCHRRWSAGFAARPTRRTATYTHNSDQRRSVEVVNLSVRKLYFLLLSELRCLRTRFLYIQHGSLYHRSRASGSQGRNRDAGTRREDLRICFIASWPASTVPSCAPLDP